jgi:hypothetical protein
MRARERAPSEREGGSMTKGCGAVNALRGSRLPAPTDNPLRLDRQPGRSLRRMPIPAEPRVTDRFAPLGDHLNVMAPGGS